VRWRKRLFGSLLFLQAVNVPFCAGRLCDFINLEKVTFTYLGK